MSEIPEDLLYTPEHEWIRVDGNRAEVGITHHAQSELGDIVYVELPQIGSSVCQKDGVAIVESVKAASDVYSPLTGEIVEINEKLSDNPEIINSSPYEDGWFFKVKPQNINELDEMLDSDAYKKLSEE